MNIRQVSVYLLFGVVFSFPVIRKIKEKTKENTVTDILYIVLMTALFILSLASIVSSSYNPFIYFNF